MKFSKIFIPVIFIFLVALACNGVSDKKKQEPVPSTENKGIDEIKKTHREIDSIKSLKKKKSKSLDTLKPGIATVELTDE